MTVQNTNSTTGSAAAVDGVATPLTQLTKAQRQKVTSELMRIHEMVSVADDKDVHKDKCTDKADRACGIDYKPQK